MRWAPANATVDQVQVLGGALVRLLAFTHVSVQAASARRHCRRLHCKWLVWLQQEVGGQSTTGRLNSPSSVRFLQQMLKEPKEIQDIQPAFVVFCAVAHVSCAVYKQTIVIEQHCT